MTTYNITHPSPDSANTPQTGGGTTSAKTNAWRKALEKEQAEILQNSKSVKLNTLNGKLTEATSSNSPISTKAPVQSAQLPDDKHRYFQPGPSSPFQAARSPSSREAAATQFPHARAQLVSESVVAMNFQLKISGGKSIAPSAEVSGAIALLEARMKQKWPLKHIHLAPADGGARVWIRDADLAATGSDIQSLAERIKQLLNAEGQKLVGLVLNGQTIQ